MQSLTYLKDTLLPLRHLKVYNPQNQGHFEGSYFPGEGGSIIFAAHNAQEFFMYIPNLKIGDKIKVSTTYGDFNYVVYNYQIIKDNETDKMPINKGFWIEELDMSKISDAFLKIR